jgi:hypothetical protein
LQALVYDRYFVSTGSRRPTCWYGGWLKRDPGFTHQPYWQLASVLRSQGDTKEADAVLQADKDRELSESWQGREYIKSAGLGLLALTIGNGIGSAIFRVLYWVAGFTVVGAVVLTASAAARQKGFIWSLAASLDQLLPIVQLNKEFGDFFDDPKRERLKTWQIAYFAAHAVVGYLLGSFVVAALAGFTRHG